MEIDFHFGATYVVARVAGFDHDQAQIIATCAQYVDDTVNSGTVNFKTGEAYSRNNTAHKFSDYHIFFAVEERKVWVPFHFLPGNDPEGGHDLEFYNRMVCRAGSEVAYAVAALPITKRDRPFALHQLGITAHTFIDTWAHQGFAGISHPINVARNIIPNLDENNRGSGFSNDAVQSGAQRGFFQFMRPLISKVEDRFFPMGHGTVLHYPDHPFRTWSYVNGHGETIKRDNPKDFLIALKELNKLFQRYLKNDAKAETREFQSDDLALIEDKIINLTDEDGEVRLESWLQSIRAGEFSFGSADPHYDTTGKRSWKYEALGVLDESVSSSKKYDYSDAFLKSNWKHFHDAAKAQQFEVLHEIFPRFKLAPV